MIVATSGCFAILHEGHLALFEAMRELAGPDGTVEVYLNSDASVERIKGKEKLVFTAEQRKKHILKNRDIDYVYFFEEDDPSKIIEERKPDLWVKSSGYSSKNDLIETATVESYGGSVLIFESPVKISTTQIMEKIRNV